MGYSDRVRRLRRPTETGRRDRTILLCALALTTLTACGSGSPAAAPTTVSPAATTISAPPATPSAVPVVDPYAGQPLIDHVGWVEAIDGARLLVYPTQAGRQTTFPGADERAWQEMIAQSPDANAPGMRDQFVCHWAWARLVQPDKPSWNLEPWRPAVGYQATVEARCNPGGPER